MKQKTVAYYTLGCKLNFAETSSIARNLTENGFAKVAFESVADIYVINTCSVTENADRKCRTIVRKALRISPGAFIIVVGCYAQLKPKEIASLPGVDLVLGAKEKFNISNYLHDISKKKNGIFHACEISETKIFSQAFSIEERTRSFLKIQDGCDYSCSFCTIPLARGNSRSDSLKNVLANAKQIASSGIKEIVLTGVNTGDFGRTDKNNSGESFMGLIQELDKIEEVERFRISSIEPNLLSTKIIDFICSSNRFMPHFHIPLQSGSDKILKLMRRRYVSSLYAEKVAYIKTLMPHACIGVDVIVGFPGETNSNFLDTYHFIKDIDISYLHVFSYSGRPDTVAIDLQNQVSDKDKAERSEQLRNLSQKKKRQFYENHVGTKRIVLFESMNEDNTISGFTDNYIRVNIDYEPGLINSVINCHLRDISEHDEMVGQIPDFAKVI